MKVSLQFLCRTLRMELNHLGIQVITVNPGAVETPLLEKTEREFATTNEDSPFHIVCNLFFFVCFNHKQNECEVNTHKHTNTQT